MSGELLILHRNIFPDNKKDLLHVLKKIRNEKPTDPIIKYDYSSVEQTIMEVLNMKTARQIIASCPYNIICKDCNQVSIELLTIANLVCFNVAVLAQINQFIKSSILPFCSIGFDILSKEFNTNVKIKLKRDNEILTVYMFYWHCVRINDDYNPKLIDIIRKEASVDMCICITNLFIETIPDYNAIFDLLKHVSINVLYISYHLLADSRFLDIVEYLDSVKYIKVQNDGIDIPYTVIKNIVTDKDLKLAMFAVAYQYKTLYYKSV